jgi:hypothetical protein
MYYSQDPYSKSSMVFMLSRADMTYARGEAHQFLERHRSIVEQLGRIVGLLKNSVSNG